MRINRKSLERVIRNTVDQRTRTDRNIVAIYLCGSLIENDYEIGGTVDLDLFFIHTGPVDVEREIVRLTDDVHLDIAHHDQKEYRDTRKLRIHPWMGPNINGCVIYYDPGHFMDFTQASVRGQFDRPDYTLTRARKQADSARQVWFAYEMEQPEVKPAEILEYLQAVCNAGNAVASLNGPPLTERRYLLKFPQRAELVDRPGLSAGLMGLLGVQNVEVEQLKDWLGGWEAAYDALPENTAPARLNPVRKLYYLRSFKSLLEGEHPGAVLWPMLHTWTLTASFLPDASPYRDWVEAFKALGFLGDGFRERIQALDSFLDQVEEVLDEWARSQGIG